MPDIAIKVENLSKRYELGSIGTGSLARDIQRWWAIAKGNEDPYAIVNHNQPTSNLKEHWALKDVSFEIKQGEAVGIIGKNGAGKSTLLKILSRVTTPTSGSIKVKGRIASLLEVGTGFHGDLTGRENIFMNGAILGMSKAEIRSKLDEIIDFSGVENYIDTPVKRYSSGMYVRLAFAVAAHLEPDILVVDEVLAVGDAEFQKKCLGKMDDVSKKEGRTVLFVSHNTDSIMRLCGQAILLNKGSLLDRGATSKVIDSYLKSDFGTTAMRIWNTLRNDNAIIRILEVKAHNSGFTVMENFDITEPIGITMKYEVIEAGRKIHSAFNFYNRNGVNIFDSHETETPYYSERKQKGLYESTVWVPENLFSEGVILIGVALITHDPFVIHFHEKDAIAFNMTDIKEKSPTRGNYAGSLPGIIRPLLQWESKKLD